MGSFNATPSWRFVLAPLLVHLFLNSLEKCNCKYCNDKRKIFTVGGRPNADPEELQKDLTAGPVVIQELCLSQWPDIADPTVQLNPSSERGSGCWITAAISP